MPSPPAPKLSIERLVKHYGQRNVVDGISLSVDAGETVVLLGPSGCGKTTLLRMIAGFVDPDDGRILVGGQEVASRTTLVPPEHRSLSMVFQNYAVWPHKTVYENLAYGLRLKRLPAAEVRRQVEAGLETVHMADYAGRYPAELSGGQQQRVALARALVLEPEILLFDEPLSNLDAFLREQMRFEIRHILKTRGITSIYVTHDQGEAMAIADRIAVMNQGRIEQIASPREIYQHSATRFVATFIGSANVIDGHWLPATQDEAAIAVAGAGTLRIALPSGQTAPTSGPASIFLRPENIALSATRPVAANVLQGVVKQGNFLGASIEYLIELDGGPSLRVTRPGAEPPHAAGSRPWLAFSPADASLLPAP